MTETTGTTKPQLQLDVINVDPVLHTPIVKKFRGLIAPDVISFVIFSVVLTVLTILRGFHIIPVIFLVLCVIGLIWNIKSLVAVMNKKYGCYLVTVDKVWEENGAYLCRITPDTYGKYDFTTEITIKNYTKKYKDVKAGDRVIVAAGKFSRYIYIFGYEGDIQIAETLDMTVTENPLNGEKKSHIKMFEDIREQKIEGVGMVYFGVQSTDEGLYFEHQEGLNDSMFGPHLIISVAGCKIPEHRFDDAVEAIEATYRNSDLILEGFYDMVLRTISSEMIMSLESGEIDKEYIKEQFIIDEMDVSVYDDLLHGRDDIEISLYGNVEVETGRRLLEGKTFLIHINCMTGEVNYELKNF